MALSAPTQIALASSTNVSCTTGSFTPTNGVRLFAISGGRRGSSNPPNKPTISDTEGLIWTEVGDFLQTVASGGALHRINVYTAVANGNAMTVSTVYVGGSNCFVVVIDYPGAGVPGANSAVGENLVGDPSATISAVTSGSGVLGIFYGTGAAAVTPPTGYTEIYEGGLPSTVETVEIVYDNSSPATTLAWTTGNTGSIGAAMEIPLASTTNALTATGISSATVVANPALAQGHAVTATGVSSATFVASPALGSKHVVAATGVSAATSVAAPALGQSHALTATGVASASKVATPALASIFSLTGLGVKSDSSVATPALKQRHILLPSTIFSDSFVGRPNIPVAGASLGGGTGKRISGRYVPIQHPEENVLSLHQVVVQLKQAVESLQNMKDS